ncbi:Scavenger receptor cysteine-rich domain superfamily protein [Stylophora pistillata]|uniref:Scavenger receptor cysteine-rich domain superfamily protein n=1 Tax=Stylophora pistillata TaxID=50429 RepID=A0A2B4R8U6_STYPI|nr:Scavenger receptor cysteine-rich domain superfamily protein [Stylophora pistillata]
MVAGASGAHGVSAPSQLVVYKQGKENVPIQNQQMFFEGFPLHFKTENNPSVGRMEIYTNNSRQKLCTSQWNEVDLNSTCMAIGYYNNGVYVNGTWYAERRNTSKTSIYHNCTIPATCEKNLAKKQQFCKVPIRLNGANVEYGGRVEVFYRGEWAKICRNGWDFDDVKVICRQLGFEEALVEFIGPDVKDEGIPFVMSNVSCKGGEPELASCARIDGEVNIPPQCLSDGKGSQALCQPKSGLKKLVNWSLTRCSCLMQDCTNATDWNMFNITLYTLMVTAPAQELPPVPAAIVPSTCSPAPSPDCSAPSDTPPESAAVVSPRRSCRQRSAPFWQDQDWDLK